MTIETRSSFYYGHIITELNQNLDFKEGLTEFTGVLNVGSYSLTDFVTEIERAMNIAGGQEYTVTLDRITREITISAPLAFDLLALSGTTLGTSVFPLVGFSSIDLTGLTTYTGDLASGFSFVPQFLLQDYIDFEDYQDNVSASVSESAQGLVQVTTFGIIKFMECNITYISDMFHSSDSFIENNPNEVSEARSFLVNITKKPNIEFMPDRDAPETFTKCLLESTSLSKSGTGFRLYELMNKKMNGRFETKKLKFRKVN